MTRDGDAIRGWSADVRLQAPELDLLVNGVWLYCRCESADGQETGTNPRC